MATVIGQSVLKGTQGSVGDYVVYTDANGNTVVRTKGAVSNPQTYQQMIQRVIIKTVTRSYSLMKDICNHSFEGQKAGAQSMQRFNKINAKLLRTRAAEISQSNGSLYKFYQFTSTGVNFKKIPAACYISEGSLGEIFAGITPYTAEGSCVAFLTANENTYKGVANRWNLKRGDQLTFITVERDRTTKQYLFCYNRIVLDPRTEDGDSAPMASTFIGQNGVQFANRRNDGEFNTLTYNATENRIEWKKQDADVIAAAVIASRKADGNKLRSTSQLVLSEEAIGNDLMSLFDAVDISLGTNSEDSEIILDLGDDLYLNNSGTGGSMNGNDTESTDSGSNSGTSGSSSSEGSNTGGSNTEGSNTGGSNTEGGDDDGDDNGEGGVPDVNNGFDMG